MNFGGGDHKTADQVCVWLFVIAQSLVAAGSAYGLLAVGPLYM